ncbi:hypothetical protein [Xanthocytophaga agilis]|uniref:Uncharacterized protein n=1 Tax=Xanthocytophaga agilis TaxID=3048010 RepID=A0AAE3RBX1_9BACT|nr:hypothetical protein [Xanthocytophaga agilis]MDJ1505465.1 hypothetical protein [Xanthocytophaga agilis]
MKIVYCLLICLLLSVFIYGQESTHISITRLTVNHHGIKSILRKMYREEKDSFESPHDDIFTVLRLEEKSRYVYEIKVGIIDCTSYTHLTSATKDSLLGYFDFKGVPVLVFSNKVTSLLTKTNQQKKFNFVEAIIAAPINKEDENKIPPPPSNFEPTIWYYTLKDREIIFNKVILDTRTLE